VEDPAHQQRLIAALETYFQDTVKARDLLADGSYQRVAPAEGQEPLRCQEHFFREARAAVKQVEQSRRTVFEPHRAPGAEVV
jgi:polyphosphate kinase